MTATNPLLDFSDLPRFDAIRPGTRHARHHGIVRRNRALLARPRGGPGHLGTSPRRFLDGNERLTRAWGIVGHLHSGDGRARLARSLHNAMLPPRVTCFFAGAGPEPASLLRSSKALKRPT
ncbi:MAG: hypothetical protein M5R42_07670 [Rhodocyclaceae bacterium]|nr:hypothetical protein [Rhodocyclaceae bacterium]